MKKIIFFFATMMFVFVIGCKKDKDVIASNKDFLTTGSWKLSAVVSDDDGDGTYETNDFINFLDCFTDNYYIFKPNGELEVNEGAIKCDPADPQTDIANWQLTNNETTLVIEGDSYAIEELNTITLKLKQTFSGNRSSVVTFSKR
ncbi:MAG: lipocalin family protein [Chitinophagaceae bacterium]|jgi:hypothetical protein|nr:lipocalin family protein [Chitinophagaceae bacterium]